MTPFSGSQASCGTRTDIFPLSREEGLSVYDGAYLEIVTEALLAYTESNVDFIDAYNACCMRQRGLCRVATFDKKHYSWFEGIAIHTPGEG